MKKARDTRRRSMETCRALERQAASSRLMAWPKVAGHAPARSAQAGMMPVRGCRFFSKRSSSVAMALRKRSSFARAYAAAQVRM
jgi:hypothetical protein